MTTSADTAAILHRLNDATKPVDAADRNLIIRMLAEQATGSAPAASNGIEQAFSSAAMSRRDELDLPGATVYIDRFVGALGLLCRSKPPRELCEQWLSSESEELQSFAVSNARIYWMTGIGIIEAAQVMADNPEEGEAHEGYTSDYAAPPANAPVASVLSDDARECLMNVVSHYDNIRAGFRAQEMEAFNTQDSDRAAYWVREIKVLERMREQAGRALLAASTGGDKA